MSIPRRTLIKGSAWAAPVLIASATVPAYAASTGKDLCPAFTAKPTETPGIFKLTVDAETERLAVTAQDGTKLDPVTFAEPQWQLATDQSVAFWISGTTEINDPTFTMTLKATPNSAGNISLVIDLPGCNSLFYDGKQITKV